MLKETIGNKIGKQFHINELIIRKPANTGCSRQRTAEFSALLDPANRK